MTEPRRITQEQLRDLVALAGLGLVFGGTWGVAGPAVACIVAGVILIAFALWPSGKAAGP